MKYTALALILPLFMHLGRSTTVQNCTSSPCDLKCSGSAKCEQECNATVCGMSCSSSGGCDSKCLRGGCSAMSCNISAPSKNDCAQSCTENCDNMDCNAFICRPNCVKDNCKMTCAGPSNSLCYPVCSGKGCEINCKSTNCESRCSGGGCTVKYGKGASGVLACPANCTFICATGSVCQYISGSAKPIFVDDPFAVPTSKPRGSSPATSKPSTNKPATTKPNSASDRSILPFILYFAFAFLVIVGS